MILTNEDIAKINDAKGATFHNVQKRVAQAEHEATLKAVGEWLDKGAVRDAKLNYIHYILVDDIDIKALKRGEMPE